MLFYQETLHFAKKLDDLDHCVPSAICVLAVMHMALNKETFHGRLAPMTTWYVELWEGVSISSERPVSSVGRAWDSYMANQSCLGNPRVVILSPHRTQHFSYHRPGCRYFQSFYKCRWLISHAKFTATFRKSMQVPPRFELGSLDSESRVLTITPWGQT